MRINYEHASQKIGSVYLNTLSINTLLPPPIIFYDIPFAVSETDIFNAKTRKGTVYSFINEMFSDYL